MSLPQKSFTFFITFLICVFLFNTSALAAMTRESRGKDKQKVVETEAGLNIPSLGIAIDAIYDKKLDDLLPGYKILNVVITNKSVSNIELDAKKDKWEIVDSVGRSHKAIAHLFLVDPKLWNVLPVGLKDELEYPHRVRMGHTTKIDLLFTDDVELNYFKNVTFKSFSLAKTFLIKNSVEKNLDWEPKEVAIPKETKATKQSTEKYKTEILENGERVDPQEPVLDPVIESPPTDPMTNGTTIPLN